MGGGFFPQGFCPRPTNNKLWRYEMSKELICILVIGAVCIIGLLVCFFKAYHDAMSDVVYRIEHMDDDDVKF